MIISQFSTGFSTVSIVVTNEIICSASHSTEFSTEFDIDKITEWMKFACDCVGFAGFDRQIAVFWSKLFTRTIGVADWGLRVIRLSVSLWKQMTTEQRRETIIHEVCHILCGNILCSVEKESHGPNWQAFMRKCGLKPSRTIMVG